MLVTGNDVAGLLVVAEGRNVRVFCVRRFQLREWLMATLRRRQPRARIDPSKATARDDIRDMDGCAWTRAGAGA